MKKLMFITPELPYPMQSGGKVKSLKLLQALAERYEITLVSPLKADDLVHLREFHQVSPCTSHIHECVQIPRTAASLAASYFRRRPLNVHRTYSENLRCSISQIADDHDVIVLDHYEVFPYLPHSFKGLTVYHAHNAYFKIWQRYAELPGNPAMRIVAYLEAARVKRYETAAANDVDVVFASPNDARELMATGVDGGKLHDTYHLGDDTQLSLPALRYENTEKKLMYVGFLGWEANVQGLLWFIEAVWPRLLAQHPDLRFDIVGKSPDRRLKEAVKQYPGIQLTGYVADLQSIYDNSRVSVAPLLFGSGMKVKVLDAMARGMPTVTTSIGAESIDVKDGEHLLIADEPGQMAVYISRLLVDEILWQQLQSSSRELIRDRYTWQKLFSNMQFTIDEGLRCKKHRPLLKPQQVAHYAN